MSRVRILKSDIGLLERARFYAGVHPLLEVYEPPLIPSGEEKDSPVLEFMNPVPQDARKKYVDLQRNLKSLEYLGPDFSPHLICSLLFVGVLFSVGIHPVWVLFGGVGALVSYRIRFQLTLQNDKTITCRMRRQDFSYLLDTLPKKTKDASWLPLTSKFSVASFFLFPLCFGIVGLAIWHTSRHTSVMPLLQVLSVSLLMWAALNLAESLSFYVNAFRRRPPANRERPKVPEVEAQRQEAPPPEGGSPTSDDTLQSVSEHL